MKADMEADRLAKEGPHSEWMRLYIYHYIICILIFVTTFQPF